MEMILFKLKKYKLLSITQSVQLILKKVLLIGKDGNIIALDL
jgi:hypothetical protein